MKLVAPQLCHYSKLSRTWTKGITLRSLKRGRTRNVRGWLRVVYHGIPPGSSRPFMPAESVCLMHLPLLGARDACWSSPLVANRAPSGSEVYRVNDSDNRQGGYTEATQNIPGAIAEVRSDRDFRRPHRYNHGDKKRKTRVTLFIR